MYVSRYEGELGVVSLVENFDGVFGSGARCEDSVSDDGWGVPSFIIVEEIGTDDTEDGVVGSMALAVGVFSTSTTDFNSDSSLTEPGSGISTSFVDGIVGTIDGSYKLAVLDKLETLLAFSDLHLHSAV